MVSASVSQPSSDVRDAPLIRDGFMPWRAFRSDPLGFMCRATQKYGDVTRLNAGVTLYLLRHPDHVQRVLVDNNRNYDKKTRGYDALRLFLRNGLLTSEGEFWRRQRRIAQPAFHRQRIAGFGEDMVAATQTMLAQWDVAAHARKPVDIESEMTALTLQIVAKTLLNAAVDGEGEISYAVTELNRMAREMMLNPFALPIWVPTPRNRVYRQCAATLDAIVYRIIEQRRESGEDPGDLLSMLMLARDSETGESMSNEQLRDETMTIFLAGHETTANTLTWTLYLLSTHPEVRRRVHEELERELGGRVATIDDLPRLGYLTKVIKESMRLYPPAWSVGRRAVEDDVMGDYRIRRNALVVLSPWITHRDPRFWPNPEGFDPERFEPALEKTRPKYAYFPFSGGTRMCIGNTFAIMEAQLVLATVLQRYAPAVVSGHPIEAEPLVTLRPKYGMPMTLLPATAA